MQSVCACYQDQYSSYFRLFRMKWSILILVVLMPGLQALCFMNVSFGQMIFLGVGHVIEFVLIFAQWQKIPQIPCSQICYWPIYVHISIFYWLTFRDICICWIPIIHTSMCLFTEMFTLLVWSGGEAWKAECLCGDLWPELLQGFYFFTIFKKKQGIWTPTSPIICIFYPNCCDMSRKKALTTSIQSTLLYVIKNILP